MVSRNEKSLEEMLQEFEGYHGKKSHHITGGWTEYPGTVDEKHTPMKIEKGPIKWPLCKLCNESLEEISEEEPKRRARKFCSDECRKEHDEIKKIRIKLKAETISWLPQKPPIPKKLLTYTIKGENGIQHKYKSRRKKNNN